MKNNFLVIFLISIVVYGCSSSDLSDGGSLNYKKYESKEIKCGKKRIKILSSCYDSEEGLVDRGSGGIVRQCRSSKLLIDEKTVINLPVIDKMNNKEKIILEEGYLSPISFSCIEHEGNSFVLINQGISNNVNAMTVEEVNEFRKPVVLNLNGVITPKKDAKKIIDNMKIKRIKVISANAVYGEE